MLGVCFCRCLSVLLPPEVQDELRSCPSSQGRSLSAAPPKVLPVWAVSHTLSAWLSYHTGTTSNPFCSPMFYFSPVIFSNLLLCVLSKVPLQRISQWSGHLLVRSSGLIPSLVVKAPSLQQSTLPSCPPSSKLSSGFLDSQWKFSQTSPAAGGPSLCSLPPTPSKPHLSLPLQSSICQNLLFTIFPFSLQWLLSPLPSS